MGERFYLFGELLNACFEISHAESVLRIKPIKFQFSLFIYTLKPP